MFQSSEPKPTPNATPANHLASANLSPANASPRLATSPMEQAHIGRSVVIKGEVTGAEAIFIEGRIEGSISFPESRVTIGRNGNVAAHICAKEVVIMGKVQGNVECLDRLDIRAEGVLMGDVITQRFSVEEGAVLKGGIEVHHAEKKDAQKDAQRKDIEQKAPVHFHDKIEGQKSLAASAGA